jgi:DNA primase
MAFVPAYLEELRSRTRLSELIARYGVKLVRHHREFVGLCPFHGERTPSFTVCDDRRFYHCFGCGAHGDAIRFVMEIEHVDFRAAVEKIAGGDGAEIARAPRPSIAIERAVKEKEERNRRRAWQLWITAADPHDTPVEWYLHSRGLLLPTSPVLRFAPACWNRETGLELPAMIARIDGPDGRFRACHRTWLLPDGSGKARLRWPKMTLAPWHGGAVRLTPPASKLVIAEGIETALSAVVAGFAAWSAVAGGGMVSLELPDEVLEVTIAADRDATGERYAERAAERWLGEGRRVCITRLAEQGTDLNDLLVGSAGHARARGSYVGAATG